MPTTYTSLLGLALPATGELSGTWGTTVNDAITSLVDSAIAGTTTLNTDADVTLTTTTGVANQARQAVILWTANGSVTRNITAPAASKSYIVINASAGTQSIVLRGAGPTTGVTIVKGEFAVVAWNGSDFVKVANFNGAITPTSVVSTSASGVLTRPAATQDGIALVGRAGGTGSWSVSLTPTTLSASRTVTFPDSNTTIPIASQVITFSGPSAARTYTLPDAAVTLAGLSTTQTFSGVNTFGNASGQTFLASTTITQDGIVINGRAGGSSSYRVTIQPATLSASRTVTLPDASTTIPVASQVLTFSGPSAARTITLPDANFTAARTDAAQTFTGTQTFGGSVVPATNTVDSVGYTGMPQNSQSAAYTLVAGDAGKTIFHPSSDNNARTFTIPANGSVPFPVGTTITFINMINTVTIAITTDTMYLAGAGTTGSRTLAAYGMATAVKITSTEWIISGNGLT